MSTTSRAAFAAAVVLATLAPPVAAVDYLGGWLPSPPKQQCVDICANAPAAYCIKPENCSTRLQRAGDFDYMVLEQLYVPQFCRDLLKGTDSTVSHQNVAPYPTGIACKSQVVKSELTIHGLWANWNNGYPGCCNVSATVTNKPFNAAAFAQNQPTLLAEMKAKWVDPTQANEYDTLCEIYNHEFQKHGLCYYAYGSDWEKAAVNYFRKTLKVADTVAAATKQINTWATSTSKTATVAGIKALYSKKVMVYCSNVDPTNKLSVIRTCWAKPAVLSGATSFTQIDCADPSTTAVFVPCNATLPVKLDAYVAQATAF